MSSKTIGILGLGYVGLPLAAEFGKKRRVVGYDINPRRIAELADVRDSTREVTAQQLQEATLLTVTNDVSALVDCGIFIVTVPTPIDQARRPDLRPLLSACEAVGRVLKRGDIVIFESTVYPGCTEEVCVPALERVSGLKFNEDFFCGYSPERVNPGDKINTITKIRKITSGSTPEIAREVDELYAEIIEAGTFMASSLKVAEAAKVIENTQRDLNIALVNELSVIFQRLNIDTLEVLEAAGSKWNFLPFRPGMVGGHCIGVDPYYLTHKAEEVGYNPQVILAGRRINDNMARYAARNVVRLMLNNNIAVAGSTVGIMGITFKENCPDTRNSKIFDLINELKSWNVNVVVEDPWASAEQVESEYGLQLSTISSQAQVDSLVVAVGHTEFRSLTPKTLRSYCRTDKPVLADLKSLYDRHEAGRENFTVFRL